jgi:SAM-dependent methyltransferase
MPRAAPQLSESERAAWAQRYEQTPYRELPWFSPRAYPALRKCVAERGIPPHARVLDIGCGAGTNSIFLRRSGYRVHGIDVAPGAIAAAQHRAKQAGLSINFRAGDALRLPFPAGFFGGAVDVGCFHTLPPALRSAYSVEVARVLRPHGRYLVCWVARECEAEWGPPHRLSLGEVTAALEREFLFRRAEFDPGSAGGLAAYHALLERRAKPQPPVR